MARILLTGGAGFIGSHTAVALIERGHDVVLLDNFENAERDVPARLARITGIVCPVIEADVRDEAAMAAAFALQPIDAVIHFAALKAVGESEREPLRYYDSNIIGTIRLLAAMQRAGVGRIVFSSSATVYGEPETCPIPETAKLQVSSIYGRTKLAMESLITDLERTKTLSAVAILRYFNPIGAHPSGLIGENPRGEPSNLMPYICQVARGIRPHLNVFGRDYPTPDGTGIRDFIHVMDLAEAHAAAVEHCLARPGAFTINLGTGQGISVLDLVAAFERVNDVPIKLNVVARRPGDVAICYADPRLAKTMLGWQASRGVEEMCRDSWRWQTLYSQ
jgi:UDP-glucose 4-epimerase